MFRITCISSVLAGAIFGLPTSAISATITGWDTMNVDIGPVVADGEVGASVVYQDAAKTVTNGQVVYTAPEANSPGIKVLSTPYIGTGNQNFDGCIMTSSNAVCDSEFQSGKRIKQQITAPGSIDLVFGVEADGSGEALYQVFHRLINVTGAAIGNFTVELGTGVGDSFTRSGDGDGLSFAQTVEFGPNKLPAFSQFPFGLFGGEPLNPNPLRLPGFFDTEERAGIDLALGTDVITSGDPYGTYDNRFGNWLSKDSVPNGLLYDFLDGADPLVMAWDTGTGWEFLRGMQDFSLNELGVVPTASLIFDYDYAFDPINGYSQSMLDYIAANFIDKDGNALILGDNLIEDAIEDLANLNLNFGILIDDTYQGEAFSLRVTTQLATIPRPAGAPLMLAAIGAMGVVARRRRT